MPDTPSPGLQAPPSLAEADELLVTLQLALQLRRQGPHAAWTADIGTPAGGPRLRFGNLNELIAFLARLQDAAPGRGLR